jgi:type I restriction enzyme R subunit
VVVGEVDFARFKRKARHFLRGEEDHIVIARLRHGKPLTPIDIEELQTMLLGRVLAMLDTWRRHPT